MTELETLQSLSNKLISETVSYRTYAKFISHLGRRESLSETINRNMTMHLDRFPKLSRDIIKSYQQVHDLKVMPSMRALQFSGEPILKNNARQYNCFSRDTEFVTENGIQSFKEFNHLDKVNILSDRGFKPATVVNFGKENIYELHVVRAGKRKEIIKTTANHRWIVTEKQGSGIVSKEVTTINLKEGNVLKYSHSMNRSPELKPCSIAIQHGMVFGDGSTESDKSTTIALCGDSTQFANLFTTGHIVNRGVKGGLVDEKIIVKNLPYFWKKLPDVNANKEYLLGFMMGWFGADGSVGQNGSNILLHSNKLENLKYARSVLSKLNIFTSEVFLARENSPYDGSYKPLYSITLNTPDLFKSFFLKDSHKEKFNEENIARNWVVSKVVATEHVEEVWCIQEPEKEMFTLANGIVTKNCSFVNVKDECVFGEILFLLLSGVGVGFSVQQRHIQHLPKIQKPREEGYFVCQDSISGWAQALDLLMDAYFLGRVKPQFDYGNIRPKGAYLVTTGASAPGPEPLKKMLELVESKLKNALGRKLTDLECHDIICIISDAVLAGGIRRAALISLFDRTSEPMLKSKSGEWWNTAPWRARANNSAILPRGEVSKEEFYSIFEICQKSGSGEPGFFWTNDLDMGTNPCVEISLNSNQFCNLTTINQTGIKNDKDFLNRVYAAAMIGTLQASYTDFSYLRESWKNQTEQEALLGVSFTGIADAGHLSLIHI